MSYFTRDIAAVVTGLVWLVAARPVFKIKPDIQPLLDLLYIDIRSDSGLAYIVHINSGLTFVCYYVLPFLVAGFLAGIVGRSGAISGLLTGMTYTAVFVILLPLINFFRGTGYSSTVYLSSMLFYAGVYITSGVLGGTTGHRISRLIADFYRSTRTAL